MAEQNINRENVLSVRVCFSFSQADVCADLVDAGWSIPVEAWSRKVGCKTLDKYPNTRCTRVLLWEVCTGLCRKVLNFDKVCLEKASGVMAVC